MFKLVKLQLPSPAIIYKKIRTENNNNQISQIISCTLKMMENYSVAAHMQQRVVAEICKINI